MYIIVELQGGESLGVKSDRVDFGIVRRCDRENSGEGVVGSVGFEDDLRIWNPMSQYWGCGKGLFEGFEGFPAFWSEVPSNPLSSQTCEQNCNIGIVKNESPINICKSEKGLNVLDFAWFGPFLDGLDLVIGH